MAGVPVGPRVLKEEFMRALGLTSGDAHCEGIYRMMREEAITVYVEMSNDRSNLKDEQRRDPSYTVPFFWHHIRDDRRAEAINRTWRNAAPGTVARRYFDLGATDGEHGPNWVTGWLLYSVFRSRDTRNNRNRRTVENTDTKTGSADDSDSDAGSLTPRVAGRGQPHRQIFDPARNSYVPV